MHNETKKILALLLLFSMSLISSYSVLLTDGYAALSLALILFTLILATKIVNNFRREKQRLQPVLRALINDDCTLGLANDEPLLDEFNRVREQINHSRRELKAQHQFLQSMLVHLDVGVLVLTAENQVLQKNPALERLLGSLPNNLTNELWGDLGLFISNAQGNATKIVLWRQGDVKDTLSVRISCLNIQEKSVKIVSIQSIYQALQAKEQQAYKRLTNVLTHEIANSIMPMMSLAQTSQVLLQEQLEFTDAEDKQDLQQALEAIARRAEHLDKFIGRFAQVTRLPEPIVERIEMNALLRQVLTLYQDQKEVNIERHNSDFKYWLLADAAQIEQVLVNLIKNSLEAIKEQTNKQIIISLYHNDLSQLVIDIEDSGSGIANHVQEQIFVPFFTTKPKGSGIGLSLSKQIMVNHGGDLMYVEHSTKQHLSGACFRLAFS